MTPHRLTRDDLLDAVGLEVHSLPGTIGLSAVYVLRDRPDALDERSSTNTHDHPEPVA